MGFENVIAMQKDGKRLKKLILIFSFVLIGVSIVGFLFSVSSFVFSIFLSFKILPSIMVAIGNLFEHFVFFHYWILAGIVGIVSSKKGKKSLTRFVSIHLFF